MANDKLLNVKQGTIFVPQVQIASASGAITITDGIVIITKSSGAAVLTIALPTSGKDDGNMIKLISVTAQAHTLTESSSGFNAGGGASDVATWGGAKGDNMVLLAYQGVWYVQHLRNVTLG